MKQVRCKLQSFHEAINAMRKEKLSSASVGTIFLVVYNFRKEVLAAHYLAAAKEAKNYELRHYLNTLIKVYECLIKENKMTQAPESKISV